MGTELVVGLAVGDNKCMQVDGSSTHLLWVRGQWQSCHGSMLSVYYSKVIRWAEGQFMQYGYLRIHYPSIPEVHIETSTRVSHLYRSTERLLKMLELLLI